MKIGIVGLPNAGKPTLFNALTRSAAEIGDYAFTTIEPNVAIVPIPDPRLERIAATLGSSEAVHETIGFNDIAGLVRGASQGEGLGNKFLAAIRETVYRRSLPLATRDLLIQRSSLGALAGVIGASSMVVDQLFSRESIARWMDVGGPSGMPEVAVAIR